MKFLTNDRLLLLNSAISAAYQAGHLITRHSQQPLSVQNKAAGVSLASQVVTEVDHLCQELILATLLPTCEKFDIAVLSEESTDDKKRLQKDFFWCVDPLDGTLPFIEQTSGFAVSIALVSRSGVPIIGVIYDPLEQTLYHAIKDSGAFRNNNPWQLKPDLDLKGQYLTIVSDRSFVQQNYYAQIMAELKTIANTLGTEDIKTIQHGGAAMNACWVLENSPGCYFKFPKPQNGGGSLWDYAATACLFHEMGGIVSDIHGNPLDLNRSDSAFMNHKGIIYASNVQIAEQIKTMYSRVSRMQKKSHG